MQLLLVWKLLKKLKIELPYDLAILLLNINPKELKSRSQRDICTPMFIVALLIIAKMWEQPECPSANEWINKMWHIHTMEYYSGLKDKEILSNATMWMSPEDIMLSKIYQSLKDKYWGFPGGAVVESLPANAGDTGSSCGLGGSHMPRSSWAREPQLLSLRVWSLCSATREAATVRGPCTAMKSGPCLPQLERALAQKRRSNTAINK